ncbi:helix-turn-helix transcriptional regulator [Photobacterium angustum]|uniref:helix-turn-helix transcriptional regulator n=1 Tax=Photobacterium angustum TaxID=661 RepID=UPI00069702CB|nr:helix-turn-helix transcriptional regulator [Photobacterium angustum]PSV88341.1 XRE family transcriptional regulator [Photobacterium angustum]PSW77437.1 XRE family transcriptional regulator [Photobacterium angustum]
MSMMSEYSVEREINNAMTEIAHIAQKIREAREWKGLTQVSMAKQLGVARQTYLDVESGKTEPRILMLMNIAKITGRPLHWFISDDNTPEYGDINRLSLMYAQVPSPLRQKMIEQNINLISCCLEYVSDSR